MPPSHVKAGSQQPRPQSSCKTDRIFTLLLSHQQLERSESLKIASFLLEEAHACSLWGQYSRKWLPVFQSVVHCPPASESPGLTVNTRRFLAFQTHRVDTESTQSRTTRGQGPGIFTFEIVLQVILKHSGISDLCIKGKRSTVMGKAWSLSPRTRV